MRDFFMYIYAVVVWWLVLTTSTQKITTSYVHLCSGGVVVGTNHLYTKNNHLLVGHIVYCIIKVENVCMELSLRIENSYHFKFWTHYW